MNAVVREWVAKAEGDWATAKREGRVVRLANYDAVCFHAQQCAEKYLKALLIQRGVAPMKIHDLAQLHRQLEEVFPLWKWEIAPLRLLSASSVMFRYPGESAVREDAKEALKAAADLRKAVRRHLGLAKLAKPSRR